MAFGRLAGRFVRYPSTSSFIIFNYNMPRDDDDDDGSRSVCVSPVVADREY